MPRSRFTDISIVLDRSGSMESIADDTIGSFNAFVADQRKEPGDAQLSLVLFDNEYTPVHVAVPLATVPRLTTETFQPRGTTALLDAIGRTILETGQRLAALAEPDRPDRVIFVIITDGHENASQDFTRERIFRMISHQRDVYSWHFEFLGANQDAIEAAGHIGIAPADSLTYGATATGTRASMAAMSGKMRVYRATGAAPAYSPAERAQAMDEPDQGLPGQSR
ncbi:vWA domain-containing protein [Tundrisphaera sp. TA3]|uniref:vWA domain-containing protein n=1 Tax=Tundrisphaera sp. TA3 TaxID=3435775 RepID=UPI003EB9C954